jgi:DNA invertase Pin-like site-specific DNA recombinase
MNRDSSVQHEDRPSNDDVSFGLRAAQYLRISTDHKNYSIHNQQAAIAEYAARNNLTIVRTYTDDGCSGLQIHNRQALKELISDVLLSRADFDRILVFDVSRWGRFQDADESAHYEFICREAGVNVEYCAEEFRNDGSLMSTIWKHMKRGMAGEFSKDLSAKVFFAQCRLVRLGFWQGGPPSFGLRRQLIDESGFPKGILMRGQRKHLQSDRVILQPGNEHEIELVRNVFREFVLEQKTERGIARELNQRGVPNHYGRPWTSWTIGAMLRNENYIGNYVYNKKTFRMRQKGRANSTNLWIRVPGTLEAIVEPGLFARAQRHRMQRRICLSNRELLARLSSLLREKGRLSRAIIDEAEDLPSHCTYINRFGSLRNAYKLIEHVPEASFRYMDARRSIDAKLAEVANRLIADIQSADRSAVFDEKTGVLTIDGRLTVSILVFRSRFERGRWGRWITGRRIDLSRSIIVVVRMDEYNAKILDYFLMPTVELSSAHISLTGKNQDRLSPYRIDTMNALSKAILAVDNARGELVLAGKIRGGHGIDFDS